MKRFFASNEDGFTLVELMVVVAIIGVLSAIAVPNFKKYQAKSKTSEAKLHLAAAYTGQQSFYADYDTFHVCLAYMGYNPGTTLAERQARYFTVGFTSTINAPAGVQTVASQNGVDQSATGCNPTGANGSSFFRGEKTLGSTAQLTDVNVTTTVAEDTFIMGASGTVDDQFAAAGTQSAFTINESKKIIQNRPGY